MSLLLFQVVDVGSGDPLPGATISVRGVPQAQADNEGNATVSADPDDEITISYVGHDTYSTFGALIMESGLIQLSKQTSNLPAVIVTPAPAVSKQSGLILGLILVGGVALSSNKKSVGRVSKNNTATIIGVAVLAAGAFYLISRRQSGSPSSSLAPAPYAPAKPVTSQSPLNAILNALPAAGGIFNSIKNFFGGSTPAFVPPSIDLSGQQGAPSPAAGYPTLNTGAPTIAIDPSAYAPPDTAAIDEYGFLDDYSG